MNRKKNHKPIVFLRHMKDLTFNTAYKASGLCRTLSDCFQVKSDPISMHERQSS